MSSLKTRVNNIEFKTPFILASGPPTRTGEMIARAFRAGWGGAVTKTICLNHDQMNDVSPRIVGVENGLKNIELISTRSPEEWAEDIRLLKCNYPEHVVIASISAEADNIEGWQNLACMMEAAGANLLELNFSCPHGLPDMNMGATCSDNPELAGGIVKVVKKAVKIPVWAKLSPNVTSIKHLAATCVKNGADGITAINTVRGFAGIDIETGMPKLNVAGSTAYGGISGKAIKPVALKAVSEIAEFVDCSVSAAGGISSWEDSVEFLLLGASTLQVCTEAMLNGYNIVKKLQEGVKSYLEKHKYSSIQELKGRSLRYIKPISCINNSEVLMPEIKHEACIKCKKCFESCFESGYQAININGSGFPEIDKSKCSGCGLCSITCPVRCISLRIKENLTSI